MVYRRRQSHSILSPILLGLLMGIVFFAYDNRLSAQDSPVEPVDTPASTARPAISTSAPTQPASVATPDAPAVATTVFIPTAGVHTTIIEVYLDGVSWDVTSLGTNAGHLQGTAWLEGRGNIVLAGHVELADGRSGIFARIEELGLGDPIILEHGNVERHYVVTELRTVAPDDLSVMYPTPDDRLTLVTCSNYNFFQDAYLDRIVVIAERIA